LKILKKISVYIFFIWTAIFAEEKKLSLTRLILSEDREYLQSKESETNEKADSIALANLLAPSEKLLKKRLQKFISKTIDKALLEEVKIEVTKYYEDLGYLFAKAVIPAGGEVSDGNLKVLVSLNKIDEIKAIGCKHFSDQYIASLVNIKKNDNLEINHLSNEIEWANKNPFRKTSFSFSPSKDKPNRYDVTLKTQDQFPAKIYTCYKNTGSLKSGTSRFFTTLNFGNLFSKSHQFNNSFVCASPINKLWRYSGTYIIPTFWKGNFEFCGAYSKSELNFIKGRNLTGKSILLSSQYRHFLSRYFEFFIKYEFKRGNNFLRSKKNLGKETFFDISQFLVGLDVNYKYQIGKTCINLLICSSPGSMTAFNNEKFFQAVRKEASPSYFYGKIKLNQTFILPYDFKLLLKGFFQMSIVKLLPPEKFSLGGVSSVRGYNSASGDNGFFLSTDLSLPKFKYLKSFKLLQPIQLLGFFDFGYTYNDGESLINKNTVVMVSVGPAFRYYLRQNFQISFDYGFQLKQVMKNNKKASKGSKAYLSASLSF
jgi:hemolysin activation/secretion protein